MSVFWIMALAVAFALLQAALFGFLNLKKLSYHRAFSRSSVYEGEKVDLIEIIRNVKPFPVPWLRVESRISPNLRFRGKMSEEREINADRFHRSIFFLSPFSQVTRRHEVTCAKRGHYEIGSVALTAGDLFAMSLKTRQMSIPCALDVYPRLLSEQELPSPCTRWQGEAVVRRWIMPDPFLMAGIREYQMGDPLRDVHWRATARTGRLQVKVHDYSADPRMFILLNVQNSEEQWGDAMEYEQETIENGIRIAATLCLRALDQGAEAGFAANGCAQGEKGSGKAVIVPAARSMEQREMLLAAMARLTLHREISFPTFLESFADCTGADFLILSAYDSEIIHTRMSELRAAGNSVTLMLLKGDDAHAAVS